MHIDLTVRAVGILGALLLFYASVRTVRYVARRYWKPVIEDELESEEFDE